MSARGRISRRLRRILRDESGTTLIEFTMVIVITLLILFASIDFGRMLFHYVSAEKAVQSAVRIAAVRPPACAGVPEIHERPDTVSTTPPAFGTSCNAGGNICADPGPQICTGAAGNATADEVWAILEPTLPNDATIANMRFRYDFDPNLGFLGGPYVPSVTVELQDLDFTFVALLPQFITLATGGGNADFAAGTIPFPALSASVPGEDLALGTDG